MATQTMQPNTSLGAKWSFFIFSKKAKLGTCLEPYSARSFEKKAGLGSLKPSRLRKARDADLSTKAKQRNSLPSRKLLSLFRAPSKRNPVEPAPDNSPKEEASALPKTKFNVQATYHQSVSKLRHTQNRPLVQLLLINQMVARIRLEGQGFGLSTLRRRSTPLIQFNPEDDDVPIAYLRNAPLKSPSR
ncbi:hypothetical protein DSO57_1010680 [Entomophthora muscae]|uniref:Uncharacterized protein n=1 Tax=Entomophthora muscae TaxID=34485 RepID=A0ACC2SJV6_9FUNG|nr:hypothetical protein DSO57_1010680 [Entomophthora muscae]